MSDLARFMQECEALKRKVAELEAELMQYRASAVACKVQEVTSAVQEEKKEVTPVVKPKKAVAKKATKKGGAK